ncbi:MAG: PqqD family protein [Planctomycetota bacterium]
MRWEKNVDVMWEELDGQALLIDTRNGVRWTLNTAATAAWKLCDGTRTLAGMARLLRYKREHLAHFCQQFEVLGMLQRHGSLNLGPAALYSPTSSPFSFQSIGVGAPSRRRPSPRGNSGPG